MRLLWRLTTKVRSPRLLLRARVTASRTGFRLILEPFETDNATVPNPVFHLVCLDASLAIAPVFERFSSVVITSGTLSPLEMYPKMLGFEATVSESYVMTLSRDCFLPLVSALLPSTSTTD